jgi:hypothetical protein
MLVDLLPVARAPQTLNKLMSIRPEYKILDKISLRN